LLGEFDEAGGDYRLWSLPLPGGSPQRIGSANSTGIAAWTPDGRGVVYSKGREAWQVNADGTAPHKLFVAAAQADFYRFSPDGTRVRFNVHLDSGNKGELWEGRADGSDLHPVVSPGDPADDCCGAWTPDGRNYFFISDRGFPGRDLYGIWSQSEARWYGGGGRLTQLTAGPVDFGPPLVAEDGTSLFAIGEQARTEIVRLEPGAAEPVPSLPGISTDSLMYSPDGNWMAWTQLPEGTLWRSRRDGSDRLQLTTAGRPVANVRWSPDGTHLAFSALMPVSAEPRIFVIPAAGGEPRQLLDEDAFSPSWSADGRSVTFGGFPSTTGHRLRTVDLDSRVVTVVPGSDGLALPLWSPDGRFLAASPMPWSGTLALFDAKDQRWSRITLPGLPMGRVWTRDAHDLVVLLRPNRDVYKVHTDGRPPELMVSAKGIPSPPLRQPDFVGLTPEGVPLVTRNLGTSIIYKLELETK
jgi:Tol biopolymer transport system component